MAVADALFGFVVDRSQARPEIYPERPGGKRGKRK